MYRVGYYTSIVWVLCETFNTKIVNENKNNVLKFSKYVYGGLTRDPTVLTSFDITEVLHFILKYYTMELLKI